VGQGTTLIRHNFVHVTHPAPGRHRKPVSLPGSPPRAAIACGAVLFQLALGGIYSWSVLARALEKPGNGFGLTRAQAVMPFSVAIGVVFLGTFLGGRLQDRRGPRIAALLGGALYSAGTMLSALATDRSMFWLLLLSYGILGGLGLGIAYIVPVAMLQKWYPDHRGLITGVAVGGFGFGAVLASPLAQHLVDAYRPMPTRAFLPLGACYLILTFAGASFFRNPSFHEPSFREPSFREPSFRESPAPLPGPVARRSDFTCAEALRTRQWYMLTTILTLNTIAGIGFVAVTANAAATITGIGPAEAATLTGGMGLFNGAGRIMWGWLAERHGRMRMFTLLLALEGLCLLAIPYATSPQLFIPLAAVIFANFGGGYAIMPAASGDFFGLSHAGAIYGLMNIAWSIGGVIGPLLVSSMATSGSYRMAFTTLAVIVLSATMLPGLTRAPGRRSPRGPVRRRSIRAPENPPRVTKLSS
jgi:OFA family oxalate/formate antiporter-like MFS transporter